MNSIELRQIINDQLSRINDLNFLNAVKTIIESKLSGGIYQLSDFQKDRIEIARQQLKDKMSISHEVLQKEIDQWLKTK